MPQTMDQHYEPRKWCCQECKRVLGVIMRDANRVRRLYVFAIDRDGSNIPTKDVLFSMPRGLFKVLGVDSVSRPGGIECSRCGARNEWVPSSESFERLMEHYRHG